MSKVTVGDLRKKHRSSSRPASHFYHPWMKKVYEAATKPRLEKALRDHANGVLYVPKDSRRKLD